MDALVPEIPGESETAAKSAARGRPELQGLVDDVSLQLDRSAAAILGLLAAEAGEPVSKDALLEVGWQGRLVHENSLAKAIGRIRAALANHEGYALNAVYGQGYCLEFHGTAASTDGAAKTGLPDQTPPLRWAHWKRPGLGLALAGCAGAIGVATFHYLPSPQPPAPESAEASALMAFISEDLILPTDPYAEVPANPALRDVVKRTAETMDSRFAGQPAALAALDILVAKAFSGWGEYDRAALHLASAREHALEVTPIDRLRLMEIDALACQQMRLAGQSRQAEKTCAQAASDGERLASPHRFMALVNLGKLQFEIGNYAEAAQRFDQVLVKERDTPADIRADAHWFRALSLRKLARFDEADKDFRAHIDQRMARFGKDHPLTAWAHSDYGDFLAYIGEYDRARAELARAQAIFDRRLGPDHVESQSPAYSLALIHLDQGEEDRAEAILAAMLANYSSRLGRDHFWTAYVMTELALAQAMQGKADEARELLREVRANAANELFGRPGKAAWFHLRWSRAMVEVGDAATARDELRRARVAITRGFGGTHPWQARADCISARIEWLANNPAAANAELASCKQRIEDARLPANYPLRAELARLESGSSR